MSSRGLWRHRLRVVEAVGLLLIGAALQRWVSMPLWARALGEAHELPPTWSREPIRRLPLHATTAVEFEVGRAVHRGARRLPFEATCLAQAFAAQVMLRRRHEPGRVVIGVQRPPPGSSGPWPTHAWLLGREGRPDRWRGGEGLHPRHGVCRRHRLVRTPAAGRGACRAVRTPPSRTPCPSARCGAACGTSSGVAARVDRRRLGWTVGLSLVTSATGGASLVLLAPIVQRLTVGETRSTSLGGLKFPAVDLPVLLLVFVVLSAGQAALVRGTAITSLRLQQTIVDRMRSEAFAAVLAARWTFVLGQRRSDLTEMVTAGATRSGLAFQLLTSFGVSLAVAVATAVVALVVSPALSALGLLAVIAMGVVLFRTSVRPAHRLGQDYGQQNRRLHSVMADSLDSLRLVRAHDAAEGWNRQLDTAFGRVRHVQLELTRRTATVAALATVALAVSASLMVLIAVRLEVSGTAVVVVLLLVSRLSTNVRTLAQTAAQLANSLPAVSDLVELTRRADRARETPAGVVSARSATDDTAYHPLVEFRGVSFTYPDSTAGVHDLDLVVPRGEITALTGPSGAGKSTSADLVLGLLAPDSGTVLVDGRPLESADLGWWRRQVAYVPQETVLVPGSLRDNLAWSAGREIEDAECWEALDLCAAGFARALPRGLDTTLGDGGLRLSGGERQRVALARAMLRRPLLLVLDEATSALDDATESAVVRWVDSLVPAVTVLVIAHRRSTVEAADHVWRIRDGRVVGAGLGTDAPVDA